MAHPKRITKRPRPAPLKMVTAGRSRLRLIKLSRAGIGRKAVHEITGLDHRTLAHIKNGRTKYVRKETRDLIFAVAFDAHCDRALVDARPTWKRINRMVTQDDMGFTRAEIVRRAKFYIPANGWGSLQIGKTKVTARTAMKIEKLWKDAAAWPGRKRAA